MESVTRLKNTTLSDIQSEDNQNEGSLHIKTDSSDSEADEITKTSKPKMKKLIYGSRVMFPEHLRSILNRNRTDPNSPERNTSNSNIFSS